MANKPQDFPIFTSLDKNTIQNLLSKILSYLCNISSILKIDPTKIDIPKDIMYEIVERIEKRRVYFHIFYDGCKMGELNEGALICFWILKLHPFQYNGIPNNILNAKIALCLFMNVLRYHTNKTNTKLNITNNIINDIYYSFRFRDLSKEAIMLLAVTLL